ncbi:DNA polymerase III subunit chi [Aurantiacibacter sediminis]|uniref:DNA polymerase III subunit chi n=1 Tax=Aurantiacibacter sediminis TaxID=2793064 RepID=A0ABS0N5T9_9SPHN|nr:DNA polymerase III subunit chi [Aurantiacibacter sediminis]MBH5323135.1 DNA polymerase III subunit chi [Aurantiacibacter sediminis]
MKIDFYLLSSDPAPAATALLARKVREQDERLLIVANDLELLETISQTLWTCAPEHFLANGIAGDEHDARQPILLSSEVDPTNNARFILIADGDWREPPESIERVFYLFDQETITGARQTWKALQDREGMECRFWKQQGGKWVEGP